MPPLTPEEQAELIRAFIGTGSGSNQINDLENLFGFSQNLLAQAAVGVPGIDAQYISDVVQNLSYQPYDGPDPLVLQQDINVALRSVSERLGLSPDAVNELAASVAGGVPADVALATVAGAIYRDESGAPLLDVPDADRKDFDLLSSVLSEYADAVRAEQNTFVWDGQRYIERDEADVRADMEQIGLTSQFNDPNIWLFQPDQALLAASRETGARAQSEQEKVESLLSRLAQFESVGSYPRVPVVGGSPLYEDPNVTSGIIKFFEDTQKSGRDTYERMRDQGLETGIGTSFIDLAGAATPGEPLSSALENAPSLQATSAESDLIKRQQEEAIKAAQRYATFASAEQAQKKAAAGAEDLRQQITEASAEQNMLQAAAKMREQEAQEQGSIPGGQLIETYRDYLTTAFPSVPSGGGGGGRRRIRLSEDQIRSVARAAAGPLRRGMQ